MKGSQQSQVKHWEYCGTGHMSLLQTPVLRYVPQALHKVHIRAHPLFQVSQTQAKFTLNAAEEPELLKVAGPI